jgi:hypothetical protein
MAVGDKGSWAGKGLGIHGVFFFYLVGWEDNNGIFGGCLGVGNHRVRDRSAGLTLNVLYFVIIARPS